jgi:hypothetical protein
MNGYSHTTSKNGKNAKSEGRGLEKGVEQPPSSLNSPLAFKTPSYHSNRLSSGAAEDE